MRIAVLLIVCCLSSSAMSQTDPYESFWRRVYKFELNDRSTSALETVDSVYTRAKKDNNFVQITRAVLYQSKFALILRADGEEYVIEKFRREISESTPPLRNLLGSMLAGIYWDYWQSNRWKYYNRSRTDDMNADFRMWDEVTTRSVIDSLFVGSLRQPAITQAISLAAIRDLLAQADTRHYRPTLYDLLAHRALDFFKSSDKPGEPAGKRKFHSTRMWVYGALNTDSSFLVTDPCIPIYHSLETLHRNRRDTTALIDLEINRLEWLAQGYQGSNTDSLHFNSLVQLRKLYLSHPASAWIDFELARMLAAGADTYFQQRKKSIQFNNVAALQYCDSALTRFAVSDAHQKIIDLQNTILKPWLSIHSEQYVPVNKPSLAQITYKNVDSLRFAVYMAPESVSEQSFRRSLDSVKLEMLKSLGVYTKWSIALLGAVDHQRHTTEVVIPSLPPGRYLIVGAANNIQVFSYLFIRVTDIALIITEFNDRMRYQVVDRNNGSPLVGARIRRSVDVINTLDTASVGKQSDANGFVWFEKESDYRRYNMVSYVEIGNDYAEFDEDGWYGRVTEEDGPEVRAFLMTDRSIYRPGQKLHVKGIVAKSNKGRTEIASGEYVELSLYDPEHNKIFSQRFQTNSFGSFSTEITLPAVGLTGEFELQLDEDFEDSSDLYLADFESARIEFSVEEYKRPSFEITFQPLTGHYAVNDTIRITGRATSLTGADLAGATVRYTVTRNTDYGRPADDDSNMSHGETRVNDRGEFEIDFYSGVSGDAVRESKRVIPFTAEVDVTDITGETHSQSIIIRTGYHHYKVYLSGPSRVDRFSKGRFNLNISNLNNQPAEADGVVRIYRRLERSGFFRERPWPSPDLPLLSAEQFSLLFPNEVYADSDLILSKEFVTEIPFQKGQTFVDIIPNDTWLIGNYLLEVLANDPSGLEISNQYFFTVTEKEKVRPHTELLFIETDKPFYKIGDRVRVLIDSKLEGSAVTIDIESKRRVISTVVQRVSGRPVELIIPVSQSMAEGFTISCSSTLVNSFVTTSLTVPVIETRDPLRFETLTFRDKIRPGSEQLLSFRIQGSNAMTVETELLASMYDASLDQFRSHRWTFDPFERSNSYPFVRYSAQGSFKICDYYGGRRYNLNLPTRRLNYEQLDWFGFSITRNSSVNVAYRARLYYTQPGTPKPSKIIMMKSRNRSVGVVHGRILSTEGEPLPGVSILIEGTNLGTTSDEDGYYEVTANAGATIVFSFIGLETVEVKTTTKNRIDVVMRESEIMLDEIVVVAGGLTVQRKELGYQATTVKLKELSDPLVELQGQVPGLLVTTITPDNKYRVVLRGQRSLLGEHRALLVVDGVIVPSGVLNNLDPEDISSINVLNGKAAAALYGSDGSSGALIINTRSGQKKIEDALGKVKTRKVFTETAFFLPHLTTDASGRVTFTFVTPESLTRWKLMLLAHTRQLSYATQTLELQSQKEFMTTVFAPRFLRTGDQVKLSTKINNLTNAELSGKAMLALTDPFTGKSLDPDFGNVNRSQSFIVKGGSANELVWTLTVPESVSALQYKVVAQSGKLSDGEQSIIPVLPNKILVTETLPLSIRGGQRKTYELKKLKQITGRFAGHHQVMLEVSSNPVWYAVQSLPYLMEFPHECAEQTFSRYYANLLALHIVNQNPKIKEFFSKSSDTKMLMSELEKNPELKSIVLEETPWLRDAREESEQKKRVALLFDPAAVNRQLEASIDKLSKLALGDGGFPWFGGSNSADRYITQHIVSGFGHLRALQVEDTVTDWEGTLTRAIHFLDRKILEDYQRLLNKSESINANVQAGSVKQLPDQYLKQKHIGNLQIQYLYARSFFPDVAYEMELQHVLMYYNQQILSYWKDFPLILKGMMALVANRNGNYDLAQTILLSLKENSIISDELGMYWIENTGGRCWDQSEIETQALMIEVFATLPPLTTETQKLADVELLKTWLLKNKQVNRWKTTKATTEAIYALLLQGNNWFDSNESLEVIVGNQAVTTDADDVSIGLHQARWTGNSIDASLGTVSISKKDPGVAWGGLYWQYFEEADRMTSAETNVSVVKRVYTISKTGGHEKLTELKENIPIERGTLLRVRIEVATDRRMEYIYMKDMRAAALEPVQVHSEYKWQSGISYYQSTRDAATNFFFDTINPGVYVFEYDLRAVSSGSFSNGITILQSMYAPEFSSHSNGIHITVN